MSELVKCATCKTEKPLSEMKTCMQADREYSVCDMPCMIKFYKGEIKPDTVVTPDLEEMVKLGMNPKEYHLHKENLELTEQLAKANERVDELEGAILDSCSTYHFEPDISQPVDSLKELLRINSKWTLNPEISSDAARFAVENKIDLLCVMVSSASSYLFYHDKLDIRANHLDMLLKNFCNYHREQLRTEQSQPSVSNCELECGAYGTYCKCQDEQLRKEQE